MQTHVPVACVDLLVLPGPGAPGWARFGLIRRATPHQGERWCLVGGRVRYGEQLRTAARRHLDESLGPGALVGGISGPLCVCEYLPGVDLTRLHDPRQHAIASVLSCRVGPDVSCAGEAHRFAWFASIPDVAEWGFRQDLAVAAALARLPGGSGAAAPTTAPTTDRQPDARAGHLRGADGPNPTLDSSPAHD